MYMRLFAVAYLQELISCDLISKDAGTPFLGTPFPELKSRVARRVPVRHAASLFGAPSAELGESLLASAEFNLRAHKERSPLPS